MKNLDNSLGKGLETFLAEVAKNPNVQMARDGNVFIADAPIADKVVDVADKTVAYSKRLALQWDRISTGEKVNAGLWGVGAIMGAFGTLSAAQNSIARDEQNKTHVMWSQVGVCLLQAAMAAGCAYMGMKAVQGHSL